MAENACSGSRGNSKMTFFLVFLPQILIPHPKKYYICCAIQNLPITEKKNSVIGVVYPGMFSIEYYLFMLDMGHLVLTKYVVTIQISKI